MGYVNGQEGNLRGSELKNVLNQFDGFSFSTGNKLDVSKVFAGPAIAPTIAPSAPSFGLGA